MCQMYGTTVAIEGQSVLTVKDAVYGVIARLYWGQSFSFRSQLCHGLSTVVWRKLVWSITMFSFAFFLCRGMCHSSSSRIEECREREAFSLLDLKVMVMCHNVSMVLENMFLRSSSAVCAFLVQKLHYWFNQQEKKTSKLAPFAHPRPGLR